MTRQRDMTTASIETFESAVLTFVADNFHVPERSQLRSDLSLLDSGIIDSTGYLDIFKWVQEEYGIEVASEDMTPDNFETPALIARYLHTKAR